MTYRLGYYDDPVLGHEFELIKAINGSIITQPKACVPCMLKYKGMGLAAPQIGVPLHLLATQLYPDQAADQPRFGKPDVLIYLTLSDSSANYKEAEEGCLSISALYVDRMAKRQKRCSSLPSMHRSNTSN